MSDGYLFFWQSVAMLDTSGSAFLTQNKVVDVSDVCWCTRSSQSSATTLPNNRALFLQMFQKIVQSGLLPSFYLQFFHQSLRSITFELIQTYWNKVLFAQTYFSFVCCRRFLPSSYLISSTLTNYVLGDWRLFDDCLNQKLLILDHFLCSYLKI